MISTWKSLSRSWKIRVAKKLRSNEHFTYSGIANVFGVQANTVLFWCDREAAEKRRRTCNVYARRHKSLHATRVKKWVKNNRISRNLSRLKRDAKKQGWALPLFSLSFLKRKFSESDGTCHCCGEKPNHSLHVDHDHETGNFRGLLCRECNKVEGFYQKAIKLGIPQYLERADRRLKVG